MIFPCEEIQQNVQRVFVVKNGTKRNVDTLLVSSLFQDLSPKTVLGGLENDTVTVHSRLDLSYETLVYFPFNVCFGSLDTI